MVTELPERGDGELPGNLAPGNEALMAEQAFDTLPRSAQQ
jgi:hypothetical protein